MFFVSVDHKIVILIIKSVTYYFTLIAEALLVSFKLIKFIELL